MQKNLISAQPRHYKNVQGYFCRDLNWYSRRPQQKYVARDLSVSKMICPGTIARDINKYSGKALQGCERIVPHETLISAEIRHYEDLQGYYCKKRLKVVKQNFKGYKRIILQGYYCKRP